MEPGTARSGASTRVDERAWRQVYDLVVIGGGTAGLVSAAGAAGLGARVALVEKALLGGDCLNSGCVGSLGQFSATVHPCVECVHPRPAAAGKAARWRKRALHQRREARSISASVF
jgi:pyruvate/2-oxoglutarate dehydrogenase complex dihydrolipoamide dehydrogenase (E3) component